MTNYPNLLFFPVFRIVISTQLKYSNLRDFYPYLGVPRLILIEVSLKDEMLCSHGYLMSPAGGGAGGGRKHIYVLPFLTRGEMPFSAIILDTRSSITS